MMSPFNLVELATGDDSLLSSENITNPRPNCFWLFKQLAPNALPLALAKAGNSIPAKMAMMAITTSNSISVNPLEYEHFVFIFKVLMHVDVTRLGKRDKPILIAWPDFLLMRWQAQRDTAFAPSHPKRRREQRIEVERGEVGVAFDAQITSALVVGENDDDVQPRDGRGFTGHTG
jgi:hypothetical protein